MEREEKRREEKRREEKRREEKRREEKRRGVGWGRRSVVRLEERIEVVERG